MYAMHPAILLVSHSPPAVSRWRLTEVLRFLLPVLRLRTVLKQPTQGEMEDKLADLSHSLGGAFEDAVSRIQEPPEGYRRLEWTLSCGLPMRSGH
jgi:hypothetical protein